MLKTWLCDKTHKGYWSCWLNTLYSKEIIFIFKTVIKKNQKKLITSTHFLWFYDFKITFKLRTQWTKAAASNHDWAFLYQCIPFCLVLECPQLSIFGGRVCSGTLTTWNKNSSKASNGLERLTPWNELQISTCLFEEKIWLQKHLYFLAILLKNICHPIVCTVILCYLFFIING